MSILDYIVGSYIMETISGRWPRAVKADARKTEVRVPDKRAKIKTARKQSRKDRKK